MGDEVKRHNDELDSFMAATEPSKPRKRRKKRVVKLTKDTVKRRAFRVLAILSDLDEPSRERVLRMAVQLSEFKKREKQHEGS